MNSSTNTFFNCSLSSDQRIIIDVCGAAAGGVSLLTCSFVLFVAVIFRKYRFPSQRVILYLNVSVLLYSFVQILHGFDQLTLGNGNETSGYCVVTGFLDQQMAWYVMLAISCLTFDLFRKAVFLQLRTGLKHEIAYLIVIYLIPFSVNWIPFVTNTYGLARATCWIKEVEFPNCTKKLTEGIVYRFVLYWVPFYIVLLGIFIAWIVARVVAYRRKRAFKGQHNYSEQQFTEYLDKEISQYQWYPILFIIWNLFPIIVRALEAAHQEMKYFEIRVAEIIVLGLQGTLISLVYTLDHDTRVQLSRPNNIKSAILSFFTKGRKVEDYHVIPEPNLTDSLKYALDVKLSDN